ncbi:hypothetical protein TVAG_472190 [Trichomonas vaginalis G3]|uniref:EamA domain-containing protein n=1 Tax=Trichomonas vaginalis (strain ATCC PRA-98 / G3) TaxID=412133 RepID=A2F5T2_TRIV3|nr:negative regulation of mitochondrial outer membrane permeabilization protein [Trichomonas vaginalis G3]EAX99717.1 hypothetical protein TVAG_472190 [Trichomonas vaginalis G3]KAI5501426.1 negative regulation of mitochondrial outer membrane permeabilization protein [Trichomonas vaginalis G3]|eukprot:XP_001312647.1 hypothetical protein [Trichomonas vaginalis G3]
MRNAVPHRKIFKILHLIFLFAAGSIYPVLNNFLLKYAFTYKYGLELTFQNPWFINTAISFGLTLLLIVSVIKRCTCPASKNDQSPRGIHLFRIVGMPSVLFLVSSSLQSYALMYMVTTVWQLFHGFTILFTTLFAVTYRHQRLFLVDWLGLFITVAGICLAGVATMIRGIADNNTSIYQLFISFLLVIVSHGFRSFQTIKEEELTHDKLAEPIEVAAYEGVWTFFFNLCICTPVINAVPRSYGVGIYENSKLCIERLKYSSQLCLFLFGLVLTASIYFYCGIVITSYSSAIHRNMYEMVRPFFVWAFSVMTYYLAKNHTAGEKVDKYSIVELSGFFLAVLGTLIYNRFIKLPCFIYNELVDYGNGGAGGSDDSVTRDLIP